MRIFSITILILLCSCSSHNTLKQETEQWNKRQKRCEEAVTSWIKDHAQYPDSYQSLGFKEYSEACTNYKDKKVPNSECYSIFHMHRIKNIMGDTVTFSGYFKLENDYFVSVIETKANHSMGGAFPPETEIWLSKFGRPMNAKDSAMLDLQRKKVWKKSINELERMSKDEHVDFENDNNREKVKQLLDSLKKK